MARIYFAGAEKVETLRQLCELGVENVLFSFFYITRRGQLDQLFTLLEQYPNTRVFMDSGAFSFRMQSFRTGGRAERDPLVYFSDYRAFLREYGHRFVCAVELDIENVNGIPVEQIYRWREELIDLGTVPIIPVWHKDRGYDEWDRVCHDPRVPHLGIGSFGVSVGQQMRLVNRAHGLNKTIHGFAQTKILTTLRYVKFDTIDSTSWMAGTQYGIVYIFKGNKWKALEKKDKPKRKRYASYFRSIGVDPAAIIVDDPQAVTQANIIAWRNLAKRFEVMHRSHVDEGIVVKRRDGTIAYARSMEPRPTARTQRLRVIQAPSSSARESLR